LREPLVDEMRLDQVYSLQSRRRIPLRAERERNAFEREIEGGLASRIKIKIVAEERGREREDASVEVLITLSQRYIERS